MIIKQNINKILSILFFVLSFSLNAQKVNVYKIDNLLKRIHNNSDTLYIVNLWATWCKPCVAELPDFMKADSVYNNQKVKVLLVSLDFKEELEKKVHPFLKKNHVYTEVVLLDESNGNEFINKISEKWSGAIPATLITKKNNEVSEFFEKKLSYELLVEQITKFK